jgi:hypothetical protein
MRIIGAAIDAIIPALLLKAHPDVGLHGLDDVAEVQGAVGVGQGAGDEYFAGHAQASAVSAGTALLHACAAQC